jgi:chemotaxis protein methyltransferase CheR
MARLAVRLFDDSALYASVRHEIAPKLRTWPSIRVWQLGLSAAGDPWAVAIVLREEGLFARSLVYATDADLGRIFISREGDFPESELLRAEGGYTASGGRATLEEYYARVGQRAIMRSLLRSRISFFQHDPRHDASLNEFQLVLWRIESDEEMIVGTLRLLRESLCRFGLLALLGGDAPIALARSQEYQALGPRVFRRLT